MELIFASNNPGKLKEVKALLPKPYQLISLKEAGIFEELPEPFHSFRENAWSKANHVFSQTGKMCFSEDSGLVVPALGGAPGVFSARYAGAPSNDRRNNEKLLEQLEHIDDRRAYYECVICLVQHDDIHYFGGKCHGNIARQLEGEGGFGYDPLFVPEGFTKTFAQLDSSVKNEISHRAEALKKLVDFLSH